MSTITAAMVKELREKTGAAMMACKKALEESKGDFEEAISILRKAGEAKAAKRASATAAEGKVFIAIDAHAKNAFIVEVNSETDFVARDAHFNRYAEIVAAAGLKAKATTVAATLAQTQDGQDLESLRQQLVSKIGENVQVRRVALIEASGRVGSYCHGDRIAVLVALNVDNAELAKDIAMHIAALSPVAISPADVSQDLIAKEREIFAAQAQESGKPAEIINKMVEGRVQKFQKEISLTSQSFVKDPNVSIESLLRQHNAKVEAFVRFEVGEGIEKETKDFADEVMAQVQGKD